MFQLILIECKRKQIAFSHGLKKLRVSASLKVSGSLFQITGGVWLPSKGQCRLRYLIKVLSFFFIY